MSYYCLLCPWALFFVLCCLWTPVWACLFILSCLINELSASEHNDIMPTGYGILIKARKTFTTMCTVLASEKKCAECSLLLSVGNHWKGNMEESRTTFSFPISLFLSISFLCTVLLGEDPKTTLASRLCSTLCWREQAVCCRYGEPCDQRCPLIETLHRKQHIPAFFSSDLDGVWMRLEVANFKKQWNIKLKACASIRPVRLNPLHSCCEKTSRMTF